MRRLCKLLSPPGALYPIRSAMIAMFIAYNIVDYFIRGHLSLLSLSAIKVSALSILLTICHVLLMILWFVLDVKLTRINNIWTIQRAWLLLLEVTLSLIYLIGITEIHLYLVLEVLLSLLNVLLKYFLLIISLHLIRILERLHDSRTRHSLPDIWISFHVINHMLSIK